MKRTLREKVVITINWIMAFAWILTACSIDSEDGLFLARMIVIAVSTAWFMLFLIANLQYS